MKFHLNYTPQRAGFEIEHGHKLMLAGSCFASEIGAILNDHRFRTLVNPDGILFNPASICNSLDTALHMHAFDKEMLIERDGLFFSYLHHSSIHADTSNDILKKIRTAAEKAQEFLWSANVLIISFGTAHVFEHRKFRRVVANCHRQPQELFEKKLLTVNEIADMYSRFITALRNVNPGVKIIFTVSPVKYLADGLVANNLSKATLMLAVHEIVRAHSECHYFPAYELVTDDLRDYRFYKDDLAHPGEQAVRYVWEKFSACYFAHHTLELNRQIERLNDALRHRTVHDQADDSKLKEFIRRQKEEVMRLNPAIEL